MDAGRWSCILKHATGTKTPAFLYSLNLPDSSYSNDMSTNERDLIVGGQAVIEGVMMRTPNAYAIAVRKADGTIVNTAAALPKWSDKAPILKIPIMRGGAVIRQWMCL